MDTTGLRTFLAECSRHLTENVIPAGRQWLRWLQEQFPHGSENPNTIHCIDLLALLEMHEEGMQRCADKVRPNVDGETIARAIGRPVGGMYQEIGLKWDHAANALVDPMFANDPVLELAVHLLSALNDLLLALEACTERFGLEKDVLQ